MRKDGQEAFLGTILVLILLGLSFFAGYYFKGNSGTGNSIIVDNENYNCQTSTTTINPQIIGGSCHDTGGFFYQSTL